MIWISKIHRQTSITQRTNNYSSVCHCFKSKSGHLLDAGVSVHRENIWTVRKCMLSMLIWHRRLGIGIQVASWMLTGILAAVFPHCLVTIRQCCKTSNTLRDRWCTQTLLWDEWRDDQHPSQAACCRAPSSPTWGFVGGNPTSTGFDNMCCSMPDLCSVCHWPPEGEQVGISLSIANFWCSTLCPTISLHVVSLIKSPWISKLLPITCYPSVGMGIPE